jgi:hypothetical protein
VAIPTRHLNLDVAPFWNSHGRSRTGKTWATASGRPNNLLPRLRLQRQTSIAPSRIGRRPLQSRNRRPPGSRMLGPHSGPHSTRLPDNTAQIFFLSGRPSFASPRKWPRRNERSCGSPPAVESGYRSRVGIMPRGIDHQAAARWFAVGRVIAFLRDDFRSHEPLGRGMTVW